MKQILVVLLTLFTFSLHAEFAYSNYCPDVLDVDFKVSFPLEDRNLPITSYFSEGRTINGVTQPHWGIDIGANYGTSVYAAHDGIVTAAYHDTVWGNGKHVSLDTADGRYGTAYLHLSKISVSLGDIVVTGDKVGEVGNTGRCYGGSGTHLHFSYKVYCPSTDSFVYKDSLDKFYN